MVRVEHFAQRRSVAKLLDAVGTNLNAREAYRRNVLNRLTVVPSPSDGRVTNVKFESRWRNRRVKVRQIHWRIQPLSSTQPISGKCRRSGQSPDASKKLTARFANVHVHSFYFLYADKIQQSAECEHFSRCPEGTRSLKVQSGDWTRALRERLPAPRSDRMISSQQV